MNVQIKLNGNNVTQYVISYDREHKICTGIGVLDIVFSITLPYSIVPWDEIDIYENGSFQVRYYVSTASISQPKSTISCECQDKSKRLVDYFIPDQYTITEPSYSGYWVKKFLTEAGITYRFTTSDIGVLLSNNMSLGLAPAYEQIINLLQLSSWYMFFDGNGKAVIGSLQTELSSVSGTFNKSSILNITKVSDDKMLRNRAVVWGAYDPIRREYAYADVSTNTRYNYDRRDKRTMVVSNSNIPNKSSAYGIANTLLKEFSRITVEKHLTVAGASNKDLGTVVRVRSNIYNGTGLITTFGVSMSKTGLVTNIVLDERCPRLFGFFDFGDYVYVGTYGGGVWRKHIRFDPTWYDFSTGLTNMAVTDLHINNEVFGAITASGEMWYATSSDGPWVIYPIESLTSSAQDTVDGIITSGLVSSGITLANFSGLMGRAVIVDKITNILKYGIDTYSGLNYGDYFIEYSGMIGSGVMASGVEIASGVVTSGFRGWVVEYDPFTSISGIYPISVSGNFDIRVLDLENDGINDYVSVKTTGSVIEHTGYGWNLGKHTSQLAVATQDDATKVSFNTLSTFDDADKSLYATLTGGTIPSVFDNESINEREVVYYVFANNPGSNRKIKRITIDVSGTISSTTLTSPAESPSCTGSPRAIVKLATDSYRVYWESTTGSHGENKEYLYSDWDAAANTLSSQVSMGTFNVTVDPYHSFVGSNQDIGAPELIINEMAYVYRTQAVSSELPSTLDPDFDEKARNYVKIWAGVVDIRAGTFTNYGLVYSKEFRHQQDVLNSPNWEIGMGSLTGIPVKCFQSGDHPAVFWLENEYNTNNKETPYYNSWLIYSLNGIDFHESLVQYADDLSDFFFSGSGGHESSGQLTGERYYYFGFDTNHGNKSIFYNGDSVTFNHDSSLPWNKDYNNIFPLFGAFDNYYIAKNGTDWYFCNPQTLAPEVLFAPPAGYTIKHPYCTTDSLSPRYYWLADKPDSFNRVIIKTTESAIMEEAKPTSGVQSAGAVRSFISGNFFLEMGTDIAMLYLNNNVNVPDIASTFYVLQRDNSDFHIIQQASKPIRIDISNSSPVLTVQDTEITFRSNYIFENEQIIITAQQHNFGITPSGVRDYRYTMLEVPSGVTVSSGIMGDAAAEKLLLYAIGSGVNFAYTNDLYSGFVQIYALPSGEAERIEVSNYVGSGQYVFVTTSGETPMFYQKDPADETFVAFSGLPDFRATIIRLDDRV